jgi:uncharacterized membrane protein YdjX (TVP38/TMEM64 family)
VNFEHPLARRSILVVALLALILVPFLLWGGDLERLAAAVRELPKVPAAALVVALLAADIVAPVPSSIVAVAAGAMLGLAGGVAAAWLGLTLGCVLGYELGLRLGHPAVRKVLGDADFQSLGRALGRHGFATIVLTRAVPVLAEAAILMAGAVRASRLRTLVAAALANLGYVGVLAGAGASAEGARGAALAFAAAVLVPVIAWAVLRLAARLFAARRT